MEYSDFALETAESLLGVRSERGVNGEMPIHGCITTGEDWQFLRLERAKLTLDRTRLHLDQVGAILGAFQAIIDLCRPAA